MNHYLVTLPADADTEEIDALLRSWGGERDVDYPEIPFDDEKVIAVTGPRDLPQKAQSDKRIRKVSPNSTLTLYNG